MTRLTAGQGRRGTLGTPKKGKMKRRHRQPAGFALVPVAVDVEHKDPKKTRALVAFLRNGTIAAACAAAGVGRRTWYNWCEADEAFAALAAEAKENVLDGLEQEAYRRAVEGSDVLLIFLLKSLRRSQFADRTMFDKVHPDVITRIRGTQELIASQASWDSAELMAGLDKVWI